MNSKVIGIIAGLSGAVVGGALGFIFGRKYEYKKINELVYEYGLDLDELTWYDDEGEEVETIDEFEINPRGKKSEDFVKNIVENGLLEKPDLFEFVDYTKFSKPAQVFTKEEAEAIQQASESDEFAYKERAIDILDSDIKASETVEVEEIVEEVKVGNIFDNYDTEPVPEAPKAHVVELIDADTFLYGDLHEFDKSTGTYFDEDDVLAGPDDSYDIMDILTTIGEDAHGLLKYEKANGLFLRNHTTKTDYEIVVSTSSYEDAVKESEWKESD